MALANYSDLQTAIANLLNRTDLSTYIPDFITLAESAINARLNVRQMVEIATITVSSEFSAVPADYNGVRTFSLTSTNPPYELKYASPEKIGSMAQKDYPSSGQPVFYSIVGSNFQFLPIPDGTYTARLIYYGAIPPLALNSTNWLLSAYPGAYLYGSAAQAAPFLIDDDRLGVWQNLFEGYMSNIDANDAIGDFGGKLTIRARAFG